ncbi:MULTISPECIES: hypothetical protein [unclassified Bradyrhizobium]
MPDDYVIFGEPGFWVAQLLACSTIIIGGIVIYRILTQGGLGWQRRGRTLAVFKNTHADIYPLARAFYAAHSGVSGNGN